MKQILKLESGKRYTLNQIFSNDFSIAIPDLQRDYCWGSETYDSKGNQQGELVSGFLTSLKRKWEETKNVNAMTPLGLIYGYEWPKGTYQLCDGQQRITTFYLLAGELYRSELVDDNEKRVLQQILKKNDAGKDNEGIYPSLLYSIRETTLYFLSDLVEHYFLTNNCTLPFNNVQEREKTHMVLKYSGRPTWYFLEYDNDPTIQSMLGAIHTIGKFLNESFNDTETISSFAKAIATQFFFIYYDMGNRMRGEETFVVLNSTGEPLTSTENLKPLLLSGQDENADFLSVIASQWEEREDWFWKHKSNKELTSDGFSRDFYTWWLLTYGDKDTVNLLKDYQKLSDLKSNIEKIHSFYQSILSVVDWILTDEQVKSILTHVSRWTDSQDDLINCASATTVMKWLRTISHREVFLPLLLFHNKFGQHNLINMLRRLSKNYYIGKTASVNNGSDNLRPYVKFRDIINIIKESKSSSDVLNHTVWYNNDERQKERIFKDRIADLIRFETDENLRFDLNVIWSTNVRTIEEAELIKKRLNELHQLSEGISIAGYDENKVISMSNQYRVLRFLKEWGHPNGKQNYVNGRYWGTWLTMDRYSDNLSKAYNSNSFLDLLTTEDLYGSLRKLVKGMIRSQHSAEGIFSNQGLSNPRGIMRAWLIGKLLVNESTEGGNQWINKYSDYPLCVNKEEMQKNKINAALPVSIGNICLHYANKKGYWDVSEQYYKKSDCLDTPLYVGICDVDYHSFIRGSVPEDIINRTTYYIQSLFDRFVLIGENDVKE